MSAPKLRFKQDDGHEFPKWNEKIIGNEIDFLSGFPFDGEDIKKDSSGVRLLRGANITEGNIRSNLEIDRFYNGDLSKLSKYLVKENDLVIGMDGSKVGKNSALITKKDTNTLLVQRVARLRAKSSSSIFFLYQNINSNKFHSYVDKVKTSSGIPHISAKQIKEFKIFLPILEEQIKIANFLKAIDEKISTLTQKNELLKKFKKGVMQKIFNQELRFKKENGEDFPAWKKTSLAESLEYEQPTKYLVSSTEYSDKFKTPVLTAGKTFILGYTDEKIGVFEEGLPVIIFDDFTTAFKFVTFPFKVKSSAMKILRKKSDVNLYYIYSAMQLIDFPLGDEHKRYWISEYSKILIPLPCKEEQSKISDFLTTIDCKINLTQSELDFIKHFKQGLLQQMLI
jgi:type I restriction enzyme S subunit